MSQSDETLPEAAKPRVYRHPDGRRLFIIDGEPRVVDVDIGKGLGYSRDRDFRALVSRQRKGLTYFGTLLKVDPGVPSIEFVRGGSSHLRSGGAIDEDHLRSGSADARDLVDLLVAEGVLDMSKRGEKAKVWFLNKDQMRWAVTKSETEKADEFLRELFRVYKAWEDGTLEPARPAIEPPAQAALPPSADQPAARDRVAVLHEGVAYQIDGGELKVVSTSLWRVGDWKGHSLLAVHSDELVALGPLPISDGGKGVLLGRFQVELLGVVLQRTDALFTSILENLREHADGHLRIDGHRLAAVIPPDEVSRQYAAARWAGASAPDWAAVPFLWDEAKRLRVRHGRLAGWLGVSDRKVLESVARLRRELDPHGVMERFEVDAHGASVLGVYLVEIQAARLVEAMGLGSPERVAELFEDRMGYERDVEVRATRDAVNHEARVASGKARPTFVSVLADMVVAVDGMTAGMTAASDHMAAQFAKGASEMAGAASEVAKSADRMVEGAAAMTEGAAAMTAGADAMTTGAAAITEGAAAMTAGAAAMTEVAHGIMDLIVEVRDMVRRIDATCEETRDMVSEMKSGIVQLLAMARAQSRLAPVSKPLRLAFWRRRSDAPTG
jgi:hypothetical protein